MTNRQPYTFDRVVRILITLSIFGAILWLINNLAGVLLPFCIACLVAYMLEPIVQFNRRVFRLEGRVIAILLTLLETTTAIVALGFIFVPSLNSEVQQMAIMFKEYASAKTDSALIPAEVHDLIRKAIDFKKLSELLTAQDIKSFVDILASFISSGVNIVMGIVGWFIVVLYIVFIMLDYEKLMRGFKRMVPPKYRRIVFSIGHDVKTSMNLYFRGQSLVALCVGILFSIGFLIIDLPLAVVLGLFIGFLNLVPYLQLISLVPTTLLCIVYSVDTGCDFWVIWWQCMAVYAIVQVIQDLFIVPKIMGKTMGLNPAIILLSLSVWGSLFGFIGLIIALPLTTLVLSYYNRYIIGEEKGQRRRRPINLTRIKLKRRKKASNTKQAVEESTNQP